MTIIETKVSVVGHSLSLIEGNLASNYLYRPPSSITLSSQWYLNSTE